MRLRKKFFPIVVTGETYSELSKLRESFSKQNNILFSFDDTIKKIIEEYKNE